MSSREELISQFQNGYGALMESIQGVSEEEFIFHRAPEKWSIKQICIHLADTEIAVAFRLRNILSVDQPDLQPFDQDSWASQLEYEKQDLSLALDQLQILRESNLALLKSLSDEQWNRVGKHPSMGDMTLEKLVSIYSQHVYKHIGQIQEIRSIFAKR